MDVNDFSSCIQYAETRQCSTGWINKWVEVTSSRVYASQHVTDLSHLQSVVRGRDGINGYPSNCHGANAEHTYLQVPLGTDVYSLDDSTDSIENVSTSLAAGRLTSIGSLEEDAAFLIVARGGAGGKGNAFLTAAADAALTSRTRSDRNTPLRIAERGARGECHRLLLRMSRLAHLGLVGAPNAGKSTLLRRLTRARPKVAPYAFTTLKPHLGVLTVPTLPVQATNSSDSLVNDLQSGPINYDITVADLPGIIHGAAEHNTGLGVEFLSLISDCRLLVYVVDIGTLWLTNNLSSISDWRPLLRDEVVELLTTLKHELTVFDVQLGDPSRCLVVGTKLDLIIATPTMSESDSRYQHILNALTEEITAAARNAEVLSDNDNSSDRVVLVSARRGDNVSTLIRRIQLWTQPLCVK
ncbi:GTPase [Paragonimus westermani]|uniref:GTPase n=1 Tax=Paragonimus westermani TaxID=34504 RepID=A0A5J4NTF9_9TREM|nr:GTPase [Paragonimus westermani]